MEEIKYYFRDRGAFVRICIQDFSEQRALKSYESLSVCPCVGVSVMELAIGMSF